jgi:hypothetical protein
VYVRYVLCGRAFARSGVSGWAPVAFFFFFLRHRPVGLPACAVRYFGARRTRRSRVACPTRSDRPRSWLTDSLLVHHGGRSHDGPRGVGWCVRAGRLPACLFACLRAHTHRRCPSSAQGAVWAFAFFLLRARRRFASVAFFAVFHVGPLRSSSASTTATCPACNNRTQNSSLRRGRPSRRAP